MIELYENKYKMLQIDNYTDIELITKSFECEFGNKPTTIKERLDFANQLSNETNICKKFILKIIQNKY